MSTLAKIFEHKRYEVDAAKTQTPLEDIRAMAVDADPTRDFRDALSHSNKPVSLIAEIKRQVRQEG
jgi:indole-3-glycerol phosphate synthase